jgi:hypothetical protein
MKRFKTAMIGILLSIFTFPLRSTRIGTDDEQRERKGKKKDQTVAKEALQR